MIGPEHEQPQNGDQTDYFDSVSIDFCDAERELFGLLRLVRLPNMGKSAAVVLLFSQGELVSRKALAVDRELQGWEHAELDGAKLSTRTALTNWTATLADGGAGFELEVDAVSSPLDLSEIPASAPVARAAGIDRYEQLCRMRGTAEVEGKSHPVSCPGRRAHAWGAHDWQRLERWRTIYAAASEGRRAVTVAGALPAGSPGHGDELRAGHLLVEEEEPLAFEEVRVSTVYGPDGLPAKAGLELFTPGQEFPSRVTGEAICGTSVELADQLLAISFFRWSIDGTRALGCYESVASA
jgi:hypothetical protein